MTEKEKQQSGELYSASDMELLTERIKARKLCAEYNAAEYNDFQRKARLLERLVAFKGEGVTFEPDFFCNYGYNIFIGNNFRADYNCIIIDNAEVTFGDNVFIGPNCSFNTAVRPLDPETRNQRLEMAKPIKVGSNVDIGGNVTVAAGVTIGDNVIITAGSAVTEDVPSNCIASGNPCVKVKELPAYDSGTEKAPEKKPETPEKERKGRRLILEPVTPGASSESSKPAAPEKDKFPGNGRPEREGFSNNGRPEMEGFPDNRPPQGGYPNGRPPQGGYPNGRPPQGGFPNGRPPQNNYPNGRPPQGGFPNGRPPQNNYPNSGRFNQPQQWNTPADNGMRRPDNDPFRKK